MILRCVCFTDKENPADKTDPAYDRFLKIREFITTLNRTLLDHYYPQATEVVDETSTQNEVYPLFPLFRRILKLNLTF